MKTKRFNLLFVLLILFLPRLSFAQTTIFSFFEQVLLPEPFRSINELRTFIRTDLPQFDDSVAQNSVLQRDRFWLDMIFRKALSITDGDISSALFIASIAGMTHKEIPLKFGVKFPLTLENAEDFTARQRNLPRVLFLDTPPEGDRDKIQHFFGSAFLAIESNTWLANSIGNLIETGEETLVSGETRDKRDIRANRIGQLFAYFLAKNPASLPSTVLAYWEKSHKL